MFTFTFVSILTLSRLVSLVLDLFSLALHKPDSLIMTLPRPVYPTNTIYINIHICQLSARAISYQLECCICFALPRRSKAPRNDALQCAFIIRLKTKAYCAPMYPIFREYPRRYRIRSVRLPRSTQWRDSQRELIW